MLDEEIEGAAGTADGGEAENPALKAFLRGLSLVLVGLGIETFARLFVGPDVPLRKHYTR